MSFAHQGLHKTVFKNDPVRCTAAGELTGTDTVIHTPRICTYRATKRRVALASAEAGVHAPCAQDGQCGPLAVACGHVQQYSSAMAICGAPVR